MRASDVVAALIRRACPHMAWRYNTHRTRRWCGLCAQEQLLRHDVWGSEQYRNLRPHEMPACEIERQVNEWKDAL